MNKSCVIGRLGMIFSISMAIACASNIPMTIGNFRLPSDSPRTKVNDPDWVLLEDKPKISNSTVLSTAYYFNALIASVNFGTTSNASPTIP